MPLQVHTVVQKSKHINALALLVPTNAEHHEVPTFAPVASDMKSPYAAADFRPFFDTNDRGSGAECA